MNRVIIHDQNILSKPSAPATAKDVTTAIDLVDTLKSNSERAVGLAANMIGINKQIIAVSIGVMAIPMLNPVITNQRNPYETTEGCLSLAGERMTQRYQDIEIQYQDLQFKTHTQHFTGLIAEIIQHEVDHCQGILI